MCALLWDRYYFIDMKQNTCDYFAMFSIFQGIIFEGIRQMTHHTTQTDNFFLYRSTAETKHRGANISKLASL